MQENALMAQQEIIWTAEGMSAAEKLQALSDFFESRTVRGNHCGGCGVRLPGHGSLWHLQEVSHDPYQDLEMLHDIVSGRHLSSPLVPRSMLDLPQEHS